MAVDAWSCEAMRVMAFGGDDGCLWGSMGCCGGLWRQRGATIGDGWWLPRKSIALVGPEIEPDPPASPLGLLSMSFLNLIRFSIAFLGPFSYTRRHCLVKNCSSLGVLRNGTRVEDWRLGRISEWI